LKYNYFLSGLFLILILFTEFIPNLGAVDKIGPQWLFLSVVNGIILLYFLAKRKVFDIKIFRNSKIFFSYTAFLSICFLSILGAINTAESFIYISRLLIVFIGLINITLLIRYIKFEVLLWILTTLLLVESLAILNQFIDVYDPTKEFGRNSKMIGVAANINIAGFSIALLMPFALQLYLSIKNKLKIILFLLLIISSFTCFLTGSRGAILSISFVFIAFIIRSYFIERKPKRKFFKTLIIISPFLISIFATEILFDTMRYSYRINQIVERGSNSRLKYYEDTFDSFKENPLLGIGIGNWKINSINKGKRHIEGYIVPYHAHNDFLQILAETGILGFLSYISIFLFSIFQFRNFKNLFNTPLIFCSLVFLLVYLIDANLNFPIARPIMQIKLALVLALLIRNEK